MPVIFPLGNSVSPFPKRCFCSSRETLSLLFLGSVSWPPFPEGPVFFLISIRAFSFQEAFFPRKGSFCGRVFSLQDLSFFPPYRSSPRLICERHLRLFPVFLRASGGPRFFFFFWKRGSSFLPPTFSFCFTFVFQTHALVIFIF